MLLSALYEYAERNNLTDKEAFEEKPVRWVISLDLHGDFEGVNDLATSDNKRGKMYDCPRKGGNKNSGGSAEYFVDGLTAVFGIEQDPEKMEKKSEKTKNTRITNNLAKYGSFWAQIASTYKKTESKLLNAMLVWRDQSIGVGGNLNPNFIRYGVSSAAKDGEKAKYWVTSAAGQETAMGAGDLFTFEVDGQIILYDRILMDCWRGVFKEEKASTEGSLARGICLVTGEKDVPIQVSHPVSKVPGGSSMGSRIVSFSASKAGKVCSFISYGKIMGNNAPISMKAAAGYSLALNKFMADKNHHTIVGPLTICFWTKKDKGFSSLLARVLDKPDSDVVRKFFENVHNAVSFPVPKPDRFYSVTFSGNAGRIVVKHWIDQPLLEAASNIKKWFDDLYLEHIPRKDKGSNEKSHPLSIFRLACATVREAKELESAVTHQLLRAALEGAKPSVMFLKPVLYRLKCDIAKGGFVFNPSRFAFLKLILIRNGKECSFMPDKELSETTDVSYNLGCLLATLENIQAAAHDYKLKGAGVVERYYGTASSSPAMVFPLLLRLVRHHKRKIETSGKNAFWVDKKISNILAKINSTDVDAPPNFPRTLTLEEQGRFALGFYQQKASDMKKTKKTEE